MAILNRMAIGYAQCYTSQWRAMAFLVSDNIFNFCIVKFCLSPGLFLQNNATFVDVYLQIKSAKTDESNTEFKEKVFIYISRRTDGGQKVITTVHFVQCKGTVVTISVSSNYSFPYQCMYLIYCQKVFNLLPEIYFFIYVWLMLYDPKFYTTDKLVYFNCFRT